MPSSSNSAMTGRAHRKGLLVTASAQRRQKAESAERGALRRMTASESMRLPNRANSAGKTTIALSADRITTALAVRAVDRRK
jgi:hypothetical protein